MADWYYKSMGAEVGPITNKEMLELVRKGKVTPETEVRKNDSKWYRASKVGGLLEQAQKGTVQQVCPYCGHLVPNPPAKCDGCTRWVTMSVGREEGKQEAATTDVDSAMTGGGEEEPVDVDEGAAKHLLMAFAISFVVMLFIFVIMVMGKKWTTGWFVALGVVAVTCVGSLLIGLWARKKALRAPQRR